MRYVSNEFSGVFSTCLSFCYRRMMMCVLCEETLDTGGRYMRVALIRGCDCCDLAS